MDNKKAADVRQHVEPHGNGVIGDHTDAIVANSKKEVKSENEIQRLRVDLHIPVADMVEVVRTLYPSYDKPLHSKVENGYKYGIRLREDAEKLIFAKYTISPSKPRKTERRLKPRRIQARVTEAVFCVLQRLVERRKITMQDLIEGMIYEHIERHKEELTK